MDILVFLLLGGLGVFFLLYVLANLWLEGRRSSIQDVAGHLREHGPDEAFFPRTTPKHVLRNALVIQMPLRGRVWGNSKRSPQNMLGALSEMRSRRMRASETWRAARPDKARHA